MNAEALAELAKLKRGARAVWAAGDYAAVAERQLWEVGAQVVRRVAVCPGEDVLEVGCGSGNAALRAAQAGQMWWRWISSRSCSRPVAGWPPTPAS